METAIVESSKHSVLGASAASRYLQCSGSVQLAQGVPRQPSSQYAEEGTAAHIMCDECLANPACTPQSYLGCEITTPEGSDVKVTQEMVDAVKIYVEYCRELIAQGAVFGTESRVDLKSYLAFAGIKANAWGTADFFVVYDNVLEVVDFKYGQGVGVSPAFNEQAMFYGLGVLAAPQVKQRIKTSRIEKVKLTIVQPRVGDAQPESWVTDVGTLLDWGFEILLPGIQKTFDANATLVAGSWCRWCPARVRCPELRRQSEKAALTEFSPVPPTPADLTDKELGEILDKASLIRVFLAAVQGEASSRAESGRKILGWKLVEKRAVRKWLDIDAAEEYFKQYGGTVRDELYEPSKLKSVAQAEKALQRLGLKKDWTDIQDKLVEKKSSGSTLVPDGDPRERLEALAQGSEFSSVVS